MIQYRQITFVCDTVPSSPQSAVPRRLGAGLVTEHFVFSAVGDLVGLDRE